jgi:hypothetical protein
MLIGDGRRRRRPAPVLDAPKLARRFAHDAGVGSPTRPPCFATNAAARTIGGRTTPSVALHASAPGCPPQQKRASRYPRIPGLRPPAPASPAAFEDRSRRPWPAVLKAPGEAALLTRSPSQFPRLNGRAGPGPDSRVKHPRSSRRRSGSRSRREQRLDEPELNMAEEAARAKGAVKPLSEPSDNGFYMKARVI